MFRTWESKDSLAVYLSECRQGEGLSGLAACKWPKASWTSEPAFPWISEHDSGAIQQSSPHRLPQCGGKSGMAPSGWLLAFLIGFVYQIYSCKLLEKMFVFSSCLAHQVVDHCPRQCLLRTMDISALRPVSPACWRSRFLLSTNDGLSAQLQKFATFSFRSAVTSVLEVLTACTPLWATKEVLCQTHSWEITQWDTQMLPRLSYE